ncbi:MAG: ATP-binding protein [Nitrospinota bacterium]
MEKRLPEILEKLAGATDRDHLSKAVKGAISLLVEASGMDAGWVRIRRVKGDLEISSEGSSGVTDFCFPELDAPKCMCQDALGKKEPATTNEAKLFCAKHGFKSVVFLPVTVENAISGFLFLASRDEREINPSIFAVVVRHLGLMITRITQNSDMEKRLKTLRTVNRVGAIISSQLTLRELTQAVVEHLGKVLSTDRVNLVLFNAREQMLEFIATFLSGEEGKSEQPEVYPLSDGMNSWVVNNRRPLLIKEDTKAECEKRGIRHGGKPAKSWLGVPMIHNGKMVGVLSVQSYTEPNLYDKTSVEMLNLVAGQVAVAVENARLYEATAWREKEKQKLYYSLTHDLLSLVTPVAGYGTVIQRMDSDELVKRKTDIGMSIEKSANRITQFVEDILTFAKIQSGSLTINTGAVNLYNIIDVSVSNFFSELNMRKLSLFVEGEKDTHDLSSRFPKRLVNCDMAQIERVLNNCMQNAVKHAASRVELTTREDGGEVLCKIFDDGEGMPKELVPKVFDEYYQMDHGKKGVGLGLPSVKRIVEQHGGKVWVETDKGKGFAFNFSLPAYKYAKKE